MFNLWPRPALIITARHVRWMGEMMAHVSSVKPMLLALPFTPLFWIFLNCCALASVVGTCDTRLACKEKTADCIQIGGCHELSIGQTTEPCRTWLGSVCTALPPVACSMCESDWLGHTEPEWRNLACSGVAACSAKQRAQPQNATGCHSHQAAPRLVNSSFMAL